MENKQSYETIGDLKGKDLINDIQTATLLFECNKTSTLELTLGDLVQLRDSAANLITTLNKSLETLPPHLKEQLEEKSTMKK